MRSPSASKSTTPRSDAADQPLDLDGAPVGPALGDVALLAVAGRRGEHPVLGRDPAAALPGHPARHAVLTPTPCRSRASRPARSAPSRSRCARSPARSSTGRSSSGARPSRLMRARVPACGRSLHLDVVDLAERQLQEARAERAERVARRPCTGSGSRRAGRAALPRPRPASACSTSSAIASPELTSATPRPSTRWSIGRDERVVGAAEDHGVDAGLAQRRAVLVARARRRARRSSPPAWISGASSGHATAVSVDVRRGLARARARRRRSRRSPAWRAGRCGRCAWRAAACAPRARPRRRLGDRVAELRPAAPGSAAAVAELQATTSSFAPSLEQPPGDSRANARELARPRGRRTGSAPCRRGRRSPRAAATRALVQDGQAADAGVEDGDRVRAVGAHAAHGGRARRRNRARSAAGGAWRPADPHRGPALAQPSAGCRHAMAARPPQPEGPSRAAATVRDRPGGPRAARARLPPRSRRPAPSRRTTRNRKRVRVPIAARLGRTETRSRRLRAQVALDPRPAPFRRSHRSVCVATIAT